MADEDRVELSGCVQATQLSAWLSDSLPGYVYVCDPQLQRYVFANRALCSALAPATDSGAELDATAELRVHPDDETALAQHHERLKLAPEPIEYRIQGSA